MRNIRLLIIKYTLMDVQPHSQKQKLSWKLNLIIFLENVLKNIMIIQLIYIRLLKNKGKIHRRLSILGSFLIMHLFLKESEDMILYSNIWHFFSILKITWIPISRIISIYSSILQYATMLVQLSRLDMEMHLKIQLNGIRKLLIRLLGPLSIFDQ